jgi:transcriptional regulator with XRE-family HTH domain
MALGLTQQEIAHALGLEQSQVSRLLAGKLARRTKAFDQLCRYLRVPPSDQLAPPFPEQLKEAVMATWDGSSAHADALATVIRALGVLSSCPIAERSHYADSPNPS